MREILFKAKRVDNGKWVKGNLFVENERFEITRGTCNGVGIESVCVDPETISQYIGLCDKNGKKIFEGDIVTSGSDSTRRKYYSEVCYDEFNCSCCNGVYGWTFVGGCGDIREYKQYEVVGNVFDNYELLEQPEGN